MANRVHPFCFVPGALPFSFLTRPLPSDQVGPGLAWARFTTSMDTTNGGGTTHGSGGRQHPRRTPRVTSTYTQPSVSDAADSENPISAVPTISAAGKNGGTLPTVAKAKRASKRVGSGQRLKSYLAAGGDGPVDGQRTGRYHYKVRGSSLGSGSGLGLVWFPCPRLRHSVFCGRLQP